MVRSANKGTWGPILRRRCTAALVLLDDAIRDCPGGDWATTVWPARDDDVDVWPVRHRSDLEFGDEVSQRELLSWFSAYWNVAHHALFFLDADLSAREIDSYEPPTPFVDADHHAHVVPDLPYTRDELSGYVVPARRYGSRPFAEIVLATVAHTHERGAQLHLFLGQSQR